MYIYVNIFKNIKFFLKIFYRNGRGYCVSYGMLCFLKFNFLM